MPETLSPLMSVALMSPDDISALVRQTIRETLAAIPNTPSTHQAESTRLALSTKEAAAALGISERTLYALTAPRGDLRSVKAGSRTLYPVADIQSWLAQNEQGGPPR